MIVAANHSPTSLRFYSRGNMKGQIHQVMHDVITLVRQ